MIKNVKSLMGKPDKRRPAWSRKKANGEVVPSRFAGGSFDAGGHVPISLQKPNSFYRRLLTVLDAIRAAGEQASGEQITRLYNERYGTNKGLATITKLLSRFSVWGYVDYVERPEDRRGGFWVLRPDIDITNVEDLLRRAREARQK